MNVIDYSSSLSNGEFLVRFTFEDDTDVFYDSEGWQCVNFNNLKEDSFYIEKAQKYYENVVNKA